MKQLTVDSSKTIISSSTNSKSLLKDFVQQVGQALPENRFITKVFVDGIPCRSSDLDKEKKLEAIDEIEIRTADRTVWEQTGLDIALSCLERVQSSLIRTSELFREPDKARANRFFAQCIEGLERFLESVTITKFAMSLDFKTISVENTTLATIETNLTQILAHVLETQKMQDFDALADKLEYELLTNLSAWNTGLGELRTSRRSNS